MATSYAGTILVKATTPGRNYEKELSFSAEAAPVEIDVDVPDSTTDDEVNCAIDYSQVKFLLILVDGALTIETNDGSSPDDTINLGGDNEELYLWTEEDIDTLKITADVTKLYLTNSSGATVNFRLVCLQDPTP